MSINLSAMWPRNNDSFGPQAQQSITSKWRPSQERRSRSNQTAWDGDRQSGSSGNAMAPLVGLPNTNGQTSIDGRLLFGPNGNGVAADLGGTINTMSNRGINVENALKGYSRSTSNPNNAFWSKTETAYDARSYPQSSNNQINNHQSSFQAANISNSFTGNLSETLPVLPQKQPIIQGKNLNLGQKIVNPADYSASFSDEQEILRRERIKEQNLQEKMNIVQKEQKMSSEITLQFKQMSRLLDSCLKLDETCSGIAPIKQNDYQIPHGNQLIQYKSIEFPPAITSFYNEEQERFGDNVSVNKGLIPQLSMAWRLKEKNEYYRQNKDRFGSRQDDRVERDAVREFNLEDIILSVSYGQPKNAIFQQNQVKDVLVIAFPTEVKVKHLKFEKSQFQLQDIDVSVSTDHELVNTVVFSKRGRIFYGGSSGRVKQIDYFSQQLLGFTLFQKFKAREGVRWSEKIKSQFQFWTGQQNVVSISVDDTRQILYALVELEPDKNIILSAIQAIKQKPKLKNKHRIDVYDLGAFDEEFELVASLSHQTFAEQLLKHSSINNFRLKEADPELNIVSVSAIEKTASSELFFMITTQSGIRAYYSINTKMACNRKGNPLTTKECKEARDKFSMFERNRPTGEFVLQQVKGMVEIKPQSGSFRSLRVFYDPKNYVGCKSMYIQYDEEQKRQIKSVFALPKGLVFQKVENGQNRLLIIDNNDAYVARLKENMFTNCKIFQDVSAAQIVASERISEISLEFSRDDSSNFISDFTIAQIPEKNLLTQATTRLLQFQSFESLEANQTVSEQSGQQSFLCLNDLSRQSYCAPSHYVVLTSKGILLSYQQRPIDTLYQVIKVLPDYITEPNQSQEQLYQQQALQARMGRLSGQQEEAYLMIQQKQNCFEFFEQFFVTYGITETFAMLTQMLCHSHFEYYVKQQERYLLNY